MNTESEQLERLIAERGDGALGAEQEVRLERALAADPAAAALARQYDGLRKLLVGWRTLRRDIDWEALAARIARRVAEGVERAKDAKVDDLVRNLAPPMPEVDWAQFKSRVSSAVRREAATMTGRTAEEREALIGTRVVRRRWRRTARWVATVGAPLAAAAVIAIVVWWPGAATQVVPRAVPHAMPMVEVFWDMPETTGHVAIQFDEGPPAGHVEASTPEGEGSASSGGGLAIAVEAPAAEPADSMDDALFY